MDVRLSLLTPVALSLELTSLPLFGLQRIHRLGQRRPVVCTKLCIEDSIESKIIQLRSSILPTRLSPSSLDADLTIHLLSTIQRRRS